MIVMVVGLSLAVFALPSALNLPQANPSQTLEYAPVPGNQGNTSGGNLAGLGLGSSDAGPASGAVGGEGPGQAPPPPLPANIGLAPSTYECVGNPPRQTEDPLSPPCVAFFNGDNGGTTYQGVTSREIRVLMYLQGSNCGGNADGSDAGSQGVLVRPSGASYDLGQAPQANEPYHVAAARVWQTYFNRRYQTYGRRAHVYVHYAADFCSDSAIAADAAQDEHDLHPFAVIFPDLKDGALINKFGKDMARYGVLSFGGSELLPAAFYAAYPGLIWSYNPSADLYAQQFASWVCSTVVNQPVKTTPANTGARRKFGIMYPSPERTVAGIRPGTTAVDGNNAGNLLGKDIQADIERCSGNPQIFGQDIATIDASGALEFGAQPSQDSTIRMHNFQSDGVTTVIWAGGFEQNDTAAASSLGYQPEWIAAGDGSLDDLVASQYQDKSEWSHAWTFTDQPLDPAWQQTYCFLAIKSIDPGFPDSDTSIPCRMYATYRLFFTAVQGSGPHLDPAHMDQGLHAIPGVQESNPQTPACFFNAGDYTCLKDSIAMWWDPTARSQFSQGPGCYRVPNRGRRYLPGGWPSGNVDSQKGASDTCNGYIKGSFADPTGQGPGAPPAQ